MERKPPFGVNAGFQSAKVRERQAAFRERRRTAASAPIAVTISTAPAGKGTGSSLVATANTDVVAWRPKVDVPIWQLGLVGSVPGQSKNAAL